MIEFLKRLFKLSLTAEEQKVLDTLNASDVTSRRVVGRGTLTILDVTEMTHSEKFRKHSEQASQIVEAQK